MGRWKGGRSVRSLVLVHNLSAKPPAGVHLEAGLLSPFADLLGFLTCGRDGRRLTPSPTPGWGSLRGLHRMGRIYEASELLAETGSILGREVDLVVRSFCV